MTNICGAESRLSRLPALGGDPGEAHPHPIVPLRGKGIPDSWAIAVGNHDRASDRARRAQPAELLARKPELSAIDLAVVLAQTRRRALLLHRVYAVEQKSRPRVLERAGLGMLKLDEEAPLAEMRRLHDLLRTLHEADDEASRHRFAHEIEVVPLFELRRDEIAKLFPVVV